MSILLVRPFFSPLVVSYFRFSVNFGSHIIKLFDQEKMFATYAFAALPALSTPFFALADVIPSEPGLGDSFNPGATCHTTLQRHGLHGHLEQHGH